MSFYGRYDDSELGFTVIAGRDQGLRRVLLTGGRLQPDEGGPVHLHHGEEILRIVSGEVDVVVGDERRRCTAGDVVIIPADTMHGFRTTSETSLEVIAEIDAGQIFPVRGDDGQTRLVEVYRTDMPWGRQPPAGFDWTTDAEMNRILARVEVP